MKLLVLRELVDGTRRGRLSPALRQLAWEACDGLCIWCGWPVALSGPDVEYDHEIALGLNGPDTLDNIAPLHRTPCHKEKTKDDKRRIAKAKRQRKLICEHEEKRGRRLQGRGFLSHLTRGFDGLVRPRRKRP